jgi:hypothetical protein
MKRNRKRLIVALLAICALAAGGAAYTAAVTGQPTNAIAGFAQTTINGAKSTAMQWQLSQDRQYITGATMTLVADGTNGTTVGDPLASTAVVQAGFNVGASGHIDWATCTTTTPGTTDTYTCNLQTATNTNGAPVTGATLFNVSVTDGNSN